MSASQSSTQSPICQAVVGYKKKPGKLQLTKSLLKWIPKDGPASAGAPEIISIEHSRLTSLFATKEGGRKVMLKICAKPRTVDTTKGAGADSEPKPDESFNFTFLSSTNASAEQELFKVEISQIILRLREPQQAPQSPQVNHAPEQNHNQPTELASTAEKGKSVDPLQDWRLKKCVLQNDPQLRQLHKEMVIAGQISEGEFWEGREELLYHEARLKSQKRGRSAQMVDPCPETTDGGEITISITPQMIRDIFEQYPVVQKVYNENVPPLTDQTFWTRYFRSKLFNRHRSSARQSGDAVKDDAIFDKYLDDDDDGIEPKNINTREVYKLLDLAATEEDHVESGNQSDWTMRAGSQRSSLPLMRRFNEHSQRLLDASLGKIPQRHAGGVIDGGDAASRNYYGETDLQDLRAPTQPERVLLDMQSQERYFEGIAGANANLKRKRTAEEEEQIIQQFTRRLTKGWKLDLARFTPYKEQVTQATYLMLSTVVNRYERKHGLNEASIPASFLSQVISLHTTTNEFLRQFWTSILPNVVNLAPMSTSSSDKEVPPKALTAEQKALKAQRMMGYIMKTEERIQNLVNQADKHGISQQAILNALEGIVKAAEAATKYYRERTS
ncbi:hypothetical protein O181_047006 [Austropuccinia psidii MF-1]|uniref:BSD domain-containing protein n=1 Tax=Austropuccinia psidii MF-1 TaxID=1389203 RepID=A0A9Q3DVA7_9BASI|nr:hypothetical protein [Austropuccinia psidii MF-1]